MEILKVKKTKFGYYVNDSISVPEAEGNRDYQAIQKWIAEGNTPEAEFTVEELNQISKNKMITNRKNYLASTDWFIARETDEPGSYPLEIKEKRILARTEINEIQNDNFENINEEF